MLLDWPTQSIPFEAYEVIYFKVTALLENIDLKASVYIYCSSKNMYIYIIYSSPLSPFPTVSCGLS